MSNTKINFGLILIIGMLSIIAYVGSFDYPGYNPDGYISRPAGFKNILAGHIVTEKAKISSKRYFIYSTNMKMSVDSLAYEQVAIGDTIISYILRR